jgi:hypothetical protein
LGVKLKKKKKGKEFTRDGKEDGIMMYFLQ